VLRYKGSHLLNRRVQWRRVNCLFGLWERVHSAEVSHGNCGTTECTRVNRALVLQTDDVMAQIGHDLRRSERSLQTVKIVLAFDLRL
jgi:hypothetical protein